MVPNLCSTLGEQKKNIAVMLKIKKKLKKTGILS